MIRVVLAGCLLAGAVAPALAQTTAIQSPVIVTEGQVTLKRAPDRAWLTMATETRDAKPAEARRKNAEAMTLVQSALSGAGVSQDAIRTTGFAVSPEMDWDGGRGILRGYVVRNQIEVRVDDLDKLPTVLDAVNSPRNVALSINGPRFDLKDEQRVQREALGLAVEAAVARAQAIAAGARRSLGQILRIEEQNAGPAMPKPMMAMRATGAAADVATPITPGEIEVQARITLTVEIK